MIILFPSCSQILKKKCPTSQHRPIYDSHDRSLLPQERKKEEKGKEKERKKNSQITTAQPSQRPHPPLLPRRERRLDQQHCDNHLHVASPLHRSHPPSSLLRLVRHVCRFEQLWRFPLQRRLGGRRGGLGCYLRGNCMLVQGFCLVGWLWGRGLLLTSCCEILCCSGSLC